MLGIVQTGDIGIMGVFTTQFPGTLVHFFYKGIQRTAQIFRQCSGAVVGGGHQQTIHHVFHRHLLAGQQVGGGFVGKFLCGSQLAGGDHRVQGDSACIEGIQNQQTGHDLGHAGRVSFFISLLLIKDLSGFGLHQQRVVAFQLKILLLSRSRKAKKLHQDNQQQQHR